MNLTKQDYSTYLKLPQLLDLQSPLSNPTAHDELIFIIIHQIHELAFKLLIHEINKIKNNFIYQKLHEATATFNRCKMLLNALNAHLQALETMKPINFLQFRSFLGSATGYQSSQFHEINQLLGLDKSAKNEKSLQHCFDIFLKYSAKHFNLNNQDKNLIIHLYKHHPEFANLFEAMIDFDIAMQSWRYGHIKLVERMIGHKQGTGGSSGLDYLLKSIHQKIFNPLWEIRNLI